MTAVRRQAAAKRSGGGAAGKNAWLAADGSKRWGEKFFLLYTPFWLTLCLGVVVPFKLYESFTELEYLVLGLVSTVPAFLIPLFLVGKADSIRSLKDRYWVKANVWIIIFSYVGTPYNISPDPCLLLILSHGIKYDTS
uniref:Uncharacterized protein n=1 Tax=Triticum urartu TaxID=4572 RepID=A0A8R7Q1H0_TRIUA